MKTLYFLRIAAFVVRFMPTRMGYWLCGVIGSLVFMTNWRMRAAVLDNMSHVLPKSSRRLRRILARKIIGNVAKNYYDVIRVPTMKPADLERGITVHGIEHLDKALTKGKGAILITGHMGNFSIVAQLAAARNYQASVVVEDIEPPKLYDYVNKMRGHFGLKPLKMGSAEIRTIYRNLKNNEVLLFAVDRDVNDEGMPVPFFDGIADMPPGPLSLALRTGAALIPGYTLRLPDNTSVVILDAPMELERTGDKEEDVRINMKKIADTLETYILKAPDQWVVLQRIWDKDYTKEKVAEIKSLGSGAKEQNGHTAEKIPAEQKEAASTSGH